MSYRYNYASCLCMEDLDFQIYISYDNNIKASSSNKYNYTTAAEPVPVLMYSYHMYSAYNSYMDFFGLFVCFTV